MTTYENDYKNIEVRAHCGSVPGALQLPRDAPVELADAGSVRLARDHLLAGAGNTDLEQDTVWRLSRPARAAHVLAAPDDGTLGAHDPRRAGEAASIDAGAMRMVGRTGSANPGLIFAFYSPIIAELSLATGDVDFLKAHSTY